MPNISLLNINAQVDELTSEIFDHLRQLIEHDKKYNRFDRCLGKANTLAGHSAILFDKMKAVEQEAPTEQPVTSGKSILNFASEIYRASIVLRGATRLHSSWTH